MSPATSMGHPSASNGTTPWVHQRLDAVGQVICFAAPSIFRFLTAATEIVRKDGLYVEPGFCGHPLMSIEPLDDFIGLMGGLDPYERSKQSQIIVIDADPG